MQILEIGRDAAATPELVETLEAGGLVLARDLAFHLSPAERVFLDPAILTRSKNVSFDPATGALSGVDEAAPAIAGGGAVALAALMRRFSEQAQALVGRLAPRYRDALQIRRTSFRPGAIAERALSPRKDDRRLHVDAFPANPVQGRRILRVFANVDPSGDERIWEVAEEGFEPFAARFLPRSVPAGRSGWLMQRLGVTKGRRTAYDEVMLRLHDRAKLDDVFQAHARKRRLAFPAGSTWIVFTDGVPHAALAGRHAFEQTFLLPVEAMAEPARAPLRILERQTGRRLT